MRKTTRYILYILIGCTTFLNIRCSGNGKEKTPLSELVHAESVMFDHPDSALHILEAMPMPSARSDKENHALWCLLFTQAQYKQMIKIPSDSLIRIAYNYYKPTNNARRKAMSALYMGGVNYNLGNVEESVVFYLEAKTEMEKTSDYQLGYLIMSGLSNIYLYRDFTTYALEACAQAYDYAVMDSNKRYQMSSLLFFARCYCLLDKLDIAEKKFKQSSEIALELGKKNFYDITMQDLAALYKNSHRYTESLLILKSLPFNPQVSLLFGQNYLLLNQLDSANYYLKKSLYTDNIYTKRVAYMGLYKLAEYPIYQKNMKTYCDSLLFYTDSVMSLDKGKEIIAYKEKYDHQKLITEQQRLKLEKAETQRVLIIVTLCLVVIISVLVYLYQKRLVRKETTIRRQSEQLQAYLLQLHENESRLQQNRRYLDELKEQLSRHDSDAEERHAQQDQMARLESENVRLLSTIDDLQHRIGDYASRLRDARKDVEQLRSLSEESLKLKENERRLTDYVVDSHKLVSGLRKKSRVLSDSEWEELTQLCTTVWGDFISRLLACCPQLTEQELRLCLLIRLRFNNTQLASIFAVSPASISQKKFRLKKHLCDSLKDAFPEDMTLDRWVTEF